MEMVFEIDNRTEPPIPDFVFMQQLLWDVFVLQKLRVYSDDENLFVVRTIEDADVPALRQAPDGSPKEVVLQFFGAGFLETEYPTALRVYARHHVPDSAILPGRIHALENQQNGITVRGVEHALQRTEFLDVALNNGIVFSLRFIDVRASRGPLVKVDWTAGPYEKVFGMNSHLAVDF
jgi:hypothetical protein